MHKIKIVTRVLLLLLVFVLNSHAQIESTIDSLHNALETETIDTNKIKQLNALVRSTLFSNTDQALTYATAFDSIADQVGDPAEMARGTNFIGMCHQVGGRPDSAITYYLAALHEYEALNDTLYQGILLNNIGSCSRIRGRHDETIRYYRRALEKFHAVNNQEWIANSLNNIGAEHMLMEQFDSSIFYLSQAIPLFKSLDKKIELATALGNIGGSHVMLGNWDEAISHFEESESKLTRGLDLQQEAQNAAGLGYAFLKKNQLEKAQKNIERSIELASRNNLYRDLMQGYEYLSAYHQETGNMSGAVEALNSFIRAKDSLINQQQDEAMLDAMQRFETEKKDQEIALLSSENEIKDLRIQSANRQRAFFITSLLGLAAIAFLIYWQLKSRQRNELILKEKNALISKNLKEKEILLGEIHHRVKNNLQFISSLLSLQSEHVEDLNALDALKQGQDRVQSMALIHQNLYQEENFTGVAVQEYFEKLSQNLFDSYNISPERISLQLHIDDLDLDVETVVPLGLIVNELLSNSLKHAFPENREGTITVSMGEINNQLILSVSDNGIGMAAPDINQLNQSFGYRLIDAFKEQLEATVQVDGTKGTKVHLVITDYRKVA